jgi:hypothetical protein
MDTERALEGGGGSRIDMTGCYTVMESVSSNSKIDYTREKGMMGDEKFRATWSDLRNGTGHCDPGVKVEWYIHACIERMTLLAPRTSRIIVPSPSAPSNLCHSPSIPPQVTRSFSTALSQMRRISLKRYSPSWTIVLLSVVPRHVCCICLRFSHTCTPRRRRHRREICRRRRR